MSSQPLLPSSQRVRSTGDEVLSTRERVYHFLNSKLFHYSILALVSLDVACLFADIIISLLTCGRRTPKADTALEALEYIGLVFSALFMLELLASIWAFGKAYFKSKFHCFDALIIVSSFIFELSLQGVTEEVASLIVILRLLRVIKIIDEISVGAGEQMKELEDRLAEAEKEVEKLKEELERSRSQ